MSQPHLPLVGSPLFKLSLDKYLTSVISSIFLSGNLFVGSSQVPFLMCTLEIPQKLYAVQVLALNFLLSLLLSLFLKLSFSQTMSFSCISVFDPSLIHVDLSVAQTQHPLASLSFLNSFIHITTFSTYRKSFCTFICQVSPLISSCQFSMNPPCSLLPCASLVFFWYLFIMLPQGFLGFLSVSHYDLF